MALFPMIATGGGGLTSIGEMLTFLGGAGPSGFDVDDNGQFTTWNGSVINGQFLTLTYTEVSPWANSYFTVKAATRCKVTTYYNDGTYDGTTATYNANDTIATVLRQSTSRPSVFFAEGA